MRLSGIATLADALACGASGSADTTHTYVPLGRVVLLLAAAAGLGGCQSALERQEIADDQSCRKIIVERNDANPTAYKDCRANMQQYRMQRAVIISGN